ncbi:MAG: hypothetical protein RI932_1705 [Pseudomonadota bacterium]
MKERVRAYYELNKATIHREGRFWLVLSVWIALFVMMNRSGWNHADEQNQLNSFSSVTSSSMKDFERRTAYWSNISRRLAAFTNAMSPAELKSHQGTWSALFEHQPEWIATHIVTRRQGFEPSIAATMTSSKATKLFATDKESPIPWSNEVQANALQLISGIKAEQNSNVSFIRSLRPNTQWMQMAHRAKAASPAWSTWVVHTFSEELLPNLQGEQGTAEVALYNAENQKFLYSKGFSSYKIESSELQSFMNSRMAERGAQEHRFAMSRKSVWIAWQKSKETNTFLIQITPAGKIPPEVALDTPSFIMEWMFALLWLATSFVLLLWSYRNQLWRLSLKKDAPDILGLEANTPNNKEVSDNTRRKRKTLRDTQRDFCQHLLDDFGSAGELKLAGNAVVCIETNSSAEYKGSWWILRNLDEGRIFLAVGDASGAGLAAATSAYTIKYVLNKAVETGSFTEESEVLIQKLYNMAALSAEGVLLGSVHTSMFMAIIEPEAKIMAFINAGYPPPELKYSCKKSILLTPHADPLGLGSDSQARPRWVNLSENSQLSICNIGCRNIDLTELDESELLKIFVYPFGKSESEAQVDCEDDAA